MRKLDTYRTNNIFVMLYAYFSHPHTAAQVRGEQLSRGPRIGEGENGGLRLQQ